MNKDRRTRIAALRAELDSIKERLETLRDEEQEAFDAMPEGLQGGERGEKSQAAIDALEIALTDIESAVDNLDYAAE